MALPSSKKRKHDDEDYIPELEDGYWSEEECATETHSQEWSKRRHAVPKKDEQKRKCPMDTTTSSSSSGHIKIIVHGPKPIYNSTIIYRFMTLLRECTVVMFDLINRVHSQKILSTPFDVLYYTEIASSLVRNMSSSNFLRSCETLIRRKIAQNSLYMHSIMDLLNTTCSYLCPKLERIISILKSIFTNSIINERCIMPSPTTRSQILYDLFQSNDLANADVSSILSLSQTIATLFLTHHECIVDGTSLEYVDNYEQLLASDVSKKMVYLFSSPSAKLANYEQNKISLFSIMDFSFSLESVCLFVAINNILLRPLVTPSINSDDKEEILKTPNSLLKKDSKKHLFSNSFSSPSSSCTATSNSTRESTIYKLRNSLLTKCYFTLLPSMVMLVSNSVYNDMLQTLNTSRVRLSKYCLSGSKSGIVYTKDVLSDHPNDANGTLSSLLYEHFLYISESERLAKNSKIQQNAVSVASSSSARSVPVFSKAMQSFCKNNIDCNGDFKSPSSISELLKCQSDLTSHFALTYAQHLTSVLEYSCNFESCYMFPPPTIETTQSSLYPVKPVIVMHAHTLMPNLYSPTTQQQ